jgi:hypothetical protein
VNHRSSARTMTRTSPDGCRFKWALAEARPTRHWRSSFGRLGVPSGVRPIQATTPTGASSNRPSEHAAAADSMGRPTISRRDMAARAVLGALPKDRHSL